jgi:hypothetical protein
MNRHSRCSRGPAGAAASGWQSPIGIASASMLNGFYRVVLRKKGIVRSTICREILDTWITGYNKARGPISDAGASANPDAHLPGCFPDGEGENDRRLVTSDAKPDPSTRHQPSDRVLANAVSRRRGVSIRCRAPCRIGRDVADCRYG